MSRLPFWLQLTAVTLGAIIVSLAWIVAATGGRQSPAVVAISAPTPIPAAATARPANNVVNSTPLPTAAPIVTATFLPTAAPTPATKPSGPSPEARAYMAWASPKIQVAGQAMGGLAQQSTQASQNPRVLADDTWKIKTGVALGFMKNAGQEIQSYPGQVSPDVRHLDEIMKGLGGDLVYVADEFAAGLDQGNVAKINNAAARMSSANQKMKEGTAEAERLNRSAP